MKEFNEIERVNSRASAILGGMVASIREGILTRDPASGKLSVSPPPPMPEARDEQGNLLPQPRLDSDKLFVFLGENYILADFAHDDRASAEELVADYNEALKPVVTKHKKRALGEIRKLLGKTTT